MKQTITSYIVRIYNNDGTEPKRLVGMVEKVGREKWRKAFRMPEELVNIIIGKEQEDNNKTDSKTPGREDET